MESARGRASRDREAVDPNPLEQAVSTAPPTMRELVQQYVRQELKGVAEDGSAISFQEEDDFEEDEPMEDLLTPYQDIRELYPDTEETLDGRETPQKAPQSAGDAPNASTPPRDPVSGLELPGDAPAPSEGPRPASPGA